MKKIEELTNDELVTLYNMNNKLKEEKVKVQNFQEAIVYRDRERRIIEEMENRVKEY